ncbi:hypothetical protein [Micromonospora chersina]|uniref:hypothetical protein n=1 Tax=Micromonospora chersina TaxID=47854 RepID=UPI003D8D3A8D
MTRETTMGVRSVTDNLGIQRATRDQRSEGVARFLGWFIDKFPMGSFKDDCRKVVLKT